MTIVEMLDSVQYVVDNQGRQTAVQFDLTTWETLQPLFEEVMEDAHLAQLMDAVADDEKLEGDATMQAYQTYLSQL